MFVRKHANVINCPYSYWRFFGVVLIVALILMNMMQISYIALAGSFVFLAFIAWLADCVIHHKDVDVDDYGFFMESDSEEERDPADSY